MKNSYEFNGWWGEGYIIENDHEDGKTWFGKRNQAIKNYCTENGIHQEEHDWYKLDRKGNYILFKKKVIKEGM